VVVLVARELSAGVARSPVGLESSRCGWAVFGLPVNRSVVCCRASGSDLLVAGSNPSTAGVEGAAPNLWPSVFAALG
jgi:hypothetical protein